MDRRNKRVAMITCSNLFSFFDEVKRYLPRRVIGVAFHIFPS